MAHLTLHFASLPKPRLVETAFAHAKLCKDWHKEGVVSARLSDGAFGWSRGVQAVAVFFLQMAAWALRHQPGDGALAPAMKGRRGSLAASLNGAITDASAGRIGWADNMFGMLCYANRTQSALPRLFFRENSDFKSNRKGDVVIHLATDLPDPLTPFDITVFVDNIPLTDSDSLQSLAEAIARSQAPPLPEAPPLSAATSLQGDVAPALHALEAADDFATADRLWGEVTLRLLRAAAAPNQEGEILEWKSPSPWRRLCQFHLYLRHGKWTRVAGPPVPDAEALESLQTPDGAWAACAARAANLRALAASRLGDDQTAVACFLWADQACRRFAGAQAALAQTHHYRGHHEFLRQRFSAAKGFLHEARRLYEELAGDSPWQAIGLGQVCDSLAACCAALGEAAAAESLYRESLQRKQAIADYFGQALTHGKLGRLHLRMRQLEQAETHLRKDIEISERIGDFHGVAVALNNLAEAHCLRAEASAEAHLWLAKASDCLDQAWSISQRVNNEIGRGFFLLGRAKLLLLASKASRADLLMAQRLAGEAVELFRAWPHHPQWRAGASVWLGWAEAMSAADGDDRALREADQRRFVAAASELREIGQRLELAEVNFQRARMLVAQGPRCGGPWMDDFVDALSAALDGACSAGAEPLARRFLDAFPHVDTELWLNTIERHAAHRRRLADRIERIHFNYETLLHSALLAAQEGRELAGALRARLEESKGGAAEDRLEAGLDRFEAVIGALDLFDGFDAFEGDAAGIGLTPRLHEEDLIPLLRRVSKHVAAAHNGSGVKIDLSGDLAGPVSWSGGGLLLEQVVYHVVASAAQRACDVADPAQRLVRIGCRCAGSLTIDVYSTGRAFDSQEAEGIFPADGIRPSSDLAGPSARRLRLSQFFARRLDGELELISPPSDSQIPWGLALRIRLRRPQTQRSG